MKMFRDQLSLLETSPDDKSATIADASPNQYLTRATAADANLGYFTSHDESAELVPDQTLEQLVCLYLRAAEQRDAHIALVWPGTFTSTPLIHSMACFGLWGNGYKRGVRGLYYPAKRNTFYPLNHVHVGRTKLVELANKIFEPGGRDKNSFVKEALHDKDAFLFTVNSFKKELAESSLRPCINELLSHFSILNPSEKFSDYSSKFYFRLKHNAGLRHRRALTATTFPLLGDPRSSPDALFSLGHKLKAHDIDEALKAFRHIPPPEVILLDATWKSVKSIPDWRQRFVSFIRKIRHHFKDSPPGILVITDEPRQLALFRVLLSKSYKDDPRLGFLKEHGVVKTHVNLGLMVPDSHEKLAIPEGKIRVMVTDFEMGALIEEFTSVANRIEDESKDAEPIWQAVIFLSKLSHLAGNLTQLWEYLNRINIDTAARQLFDWQFYRGNLIAFILDGHCRGERGTIESAIASADKLVAAYQNHTPLGLKVLSELKQLQQRGKSAAFVVRRRLHKEVLVAYLDSSGQSLNGSVVLMLEEVDAFLESCTSCDEIVFADMNPEIFRRVVSDPRIPNDTLLLLTAQMAKHLKYNITPLLRMNEFRSFHDRLNQLLQPIEENYLSNGTSLLKDDGLGLPTFKVGAYETDDYSGDEKDAVYIEVDGHLFRRGLHSHLYVYDPLAAENGYSGFRAVTADHLEPGQQIFLMSTELRERIETVLEKCGVKVGADMPYEAGLRQYHSRVTTQLNHLFAGDIKAQVRMLQDKILLVDATVESEINNIRHWVNLGHSSDTPFEKLAPQAPRHFKPFKAFCLALEISDPEIRFFWDFVIKPLRGSRRKEGRWLSDVYAKILFDPDSAIAYKGLLHSTIDELRQKATENLFVITEILLPEQKEE